MNDSMEIGVGTFALTDVRDSKDYLVRRLADGNCWMVQNLDLDLNQFTSDKTARLTPENTDVAETWIPDASVNKMITETYADKLAAENLSADFQGLATWLLGNSGQTQQFQTSNKYGASWYWGTRRNNDTDSSETIRSNSVMINTYSRIPRSYDNTVNGTTNVRYVAMDVSTGSTYKTIDISDTTSASWVTDKTGDNATIETTTSSYTPAAKLTTPGIDASTMADDVWNFYGSMYIGKYYNWYAATAETGSLTMTRPTTAASQADSRSRQCRARSRKHRCRSRLRRSSLSGSYT